MAVDFRWPAAWHIVEPVVEGVRPRGRPAEPFPPVARDGQQPRIQRLFERFDRFWIRLTEVAVLALAEPVPAHVDGGAEKTVLGVEPTDLVVSRPW